MLADDHENGKNAEGQKNADVEKSPQVELGNWPGGSVRAARVHAVVGDGFAQVFDLGPDPLFVELLGPWRFGAGVEP